MSSANGQDLDVEALSARVAAAGDVPALRALEREFLGKDGPLGALLASIPALPPGERRAAGQRANELKAKIAELVAARAEELESASLAAARSGAGFDPTLPIRRPARGGLHPVVQVARELEDLFVSMGWTVLDGPEVELEHYNFEALNIPRDHPARDMQDTFWLKPLPGLPPGAGRLCLRTHTSPVQVRAMERLKPPFRAIAPGRVFRQETTDASHDHTFYQMEGLAVDQGLSVGHLIGTMKTLLRAIFGRELEVRLRPGYFPFVEPGFELDARCPFCAPAAPAPVASGAPGAPGAPGASVGAAQGCSVCKRTTWIELLPCGMVHPNVLRAGGIDPERWRGFAFGLGLSRLTMLRHGIDDVRRLMGGDLRFLEQF
jgi:phenylalanyl-tRNA synthetase alpha chain